MTVFEQYEKLEKTVAAYNPGADLTHIREAFDFAEKAHSGQKRR